MSQNQQRRALLAVLMLGCASASLVAQPSDDDPPSPPTGPIYTNAGADAADSVFYVGPWGSLNTHWNTNTPETPFLTLQQARDELRAFKTLFSKRKIQVRIAGATYTLTDPVTFTTADSGFWGAPIQYVAWDPAGIMGYAGDDVLFSGGKKLTGWTTVTINGNVEAYRCSVPDDILDIRDVWVNNQRMVRARFPDVPTCATPPELYATSTTPPCPNAGYLIVNDVDVNFQTTPIQQRVTVQTANGIAIPTLADWSQVEVVASKTYTSPQQIVSGGVDVLLPNSVRLKFPITIASPGAQNFGSLGPFWAPSWSSSAYMSYARDNIQISGEADVMGAPPLPGRFPPAQVFLTNDLKFLTADREWYFDPVSRFLYLRLCNNANPNNTDVVVPRSGATGLLILDNVSNLVFYRLDWAHTYQAFPKQADGTTPGYTTVGLGIQLVDPPGTPLVINNIVTPAISIFGASMCTIQECRIAHTGGGAVVIGTDETGSSDEAVRAVESNDCSVYGCEIFDVGGHGVYVGDEYAQWDTTWRSQTAATISTRDPNNGNIVAYNRIENYGVVYRDCLAVYAGHTRNLRCSKNEVSYGNYTGIAVGTFLAHKISPYWPQNSEGSRVSFNKVHHVMLKLSDGGGIYLQGSHLPSTSLAPTLAGNYIHDIVLNPFLNVGLDGSNGLYWDGGSDGWEVYNNFVERTQHGYHFSGVDRINDCKFGPADYKCGNPPVFAYGYPTWPKSWYHNTYGIVIPGQSWFPGIPNYWRDEPLGAYGSYAQCYGYGEAGVSGGMQELTGSLSANRTVTTATPYTLEVNAIKGGAGVTDAAIASRFFPLVVKRIHRAAICGGLPLDPASQVQ